MKIKKMIFKYIASLILGLLTFTSYAQKGQQSLSGSTLLPLKIGVISSNLLDLYEGTTEQMNGFDDIDLYGSRGEYTKFDLAYGLLLEIPLNHQSGLEIEISSGKMTSQKENQYLKTKLSMLNINYRRYSAKFQSHNNFYIQLYGQLGLGLTRYNAERYFVKDNGLFSATEGICLSNSVSLGCLFNLTPKYQISFFTGPMFNYTDGFDGYDNQKLGDLMLKTGLGLYYKL